MSKISKITNLIIEESKNSDINFKHGAILTKGSKILAKGCNKSRSKFMNILQTCIHAELDVVHNYATTVLHRNINFKKKNIYTPELSKCTLWVGRVNKEDNLGESKPCLICLGYLKRLGIKKIGYSNTTGEMIVKKIGDIDTQHLSDAQITLLSKDRD